MEDSDCDADSMHGADASEAYTWGTSATRLPTQPSSSATSPRGHDDVDERGCIYEASKPSHDANGNSSMRVYSTSDMLRHTDAAPPPQHLPSTATATTTLRGLSPLHDLESSMLPPGRLRDCRAGEAEEAGAAPQPLPGVARGVSLAEVATGVSLPGLATGVSLRSSTSATVAGDIDDLPHRLSKQMSFHKTFETVAKRL